MWLYDRWPSSHSMEVNNLHHLRVICLGTRRTFFLSPLLPLQRKTDAFLSLLQHPLAELLLVGRQTRKPGATMIKMLLESSDASYSCKKSIFCSLKIWNELFPREHVSTTNFAKNSFFIVNIEFSLNTTLRAYTFLEFQVQFRIPRLNVDFLV